MGRAALLPRHRGRSPSGARGAVTARVVAAGSDPGAEAGERSASVCHRGRVAKLSPELKGLRDSSERAELEPLATVLEVSVPATAGGVSDPCSKRGYSYRGLSGAGTLGNFGCLVQLEPGQVLPSLQTGLVTAPVAFKSCSDSQWMVSPPCGLFSGDRKEL